MIENIKIEKLHPHPDNPRKEIGDIAELTESIKASGVFQNLTVVPATGHYDGEYTVIIGHRRLAAAKQAGLKELPCAIMEMDKREQIATMLLENMQRSDLTPYEEAQGMQMMLDLGESIEDISLKTGFSKSTIRRRTKLLKLDQTKFKESQARQVTFLEYDKLFEVEDEERRNKLLDHIGTKNFNNELYRAKEDEKFAKKKAVMAEKLSKYAKYVESKDVDGKIYVRCLWAESQIDEVNWQEGMTYYFYISGVYIYIYRDRTDVEAKESQELEEKEKENQERMAAEKERRTALEQLNKRMYQLRFDFVKECPDVRVKTDAIMQFAVWSMVQEWVEETDTEQFGELLGFNIHDEDDDPVWGKYAFEFKENPRKVLLYAAYANYGDGGNAKYSDWNGNYRNNERLDKLYEMLVMLGYELSDEEQQWKDGSHPLYKPAE